MDKNQQDPNLQAPQEANTTKHINFLDTDTGSTDNGDKASFKEDDSPTKKAWEEMRKDFRDDDSQK